ncbi:MAG TPA: Nif3-like dinuclear metal center hexameric protein, partial [Solirubrobacteraceae bacterium]|nr:Nif3-like dinuclear metal center hexameric protein [Solirubrobacteraceae bacterium]
MAALREMIAELDGLLDAAAFRDYCPNGLQVAGREQVELVVTGVSASVELFEQAAAAGAGLVLVHHGLFWDGDDPRVVGPLRERLGVLIGNDMSLAGYHLPLDAHPDFGNNALIARGLEAEPREPFGLASGRAVGWIARFDGEGIARAKLVQRMARLTGREPLAFLEGPERVRSVGIVSGGAGRILFEALDAGLDAFVTGEPEEWTRAIAREAGRN